MKMYLTVLSFALIFITGCENGEEKKTHQPISPEPNAVSREFQGCRTCHSATRHDQNHNFPCIQCHKGNEQGRREEDAHAGLVAKPAHPDFMVESCGGCHPENVENCRKSLHFTLRNKINRIREHFGSPDDVADLTTIPPSSQPSTKIELVDDMLKRRCLRCHLFSSGDTYANTQRGTGCASCHMGFSNGKLLSHELLATPSDFQCLSCHYANFVGADYYGRYEHDYSGEYRTPFTTREEYVRPYGVEYHELAPDIHQQRGLSCVDCHNGHQPFMESEGNITSCRTCHQLNIAQKNSDSLPQNIRLVNNVPNLKAMLTGKLHPIPQMKHQAHEQYNKKVSCQVCHAQWSFNDSTTHLLRNDTDDYDPWSKLHIQSSSSIEKLLEHNIFTDADELPATMPDTITGKPFPGVWHKGFTERRWEKMLVGQDKDGLIKVLRPILDLRLSYVDSNENVVFDNVQGSNQVLLPYTPHTTGKAGLFYLNRFVHLLKQEQNTPTNQ